MRMIAIVVVLSIFSPFSFKGKVFMAHAEMISVDDYKKRINDIEQKKEEQTEEKKRIKEKYDKYIQKMKEPVLMWGLGYLETVAVEMKGNLKMDLGKDRKIKKLWTSVLISKSLEIGFDYNLAKASYLPKYYLFLPGVGLGVDLSSDFRTYVYASVGGAYYLNRKIGIGVKYRKKLNELDSFGFGGLGVFLEYRM